MSAVKRDYGVCRDGSPSHRYSLPNSSEVNDTYVICEFLRNRDFVATISAMMPGFYGKR